MFKKILALTLAGSLALPFVSGGHAEAAALPNNVQLKVAATDLLNLWKLKDNQLPDVNELLKKFGIQVDLSHLKNQPIVVDIGQKTDQPQKNPGQAAQPQKPEAPAKPAAPEKPATPEKPAPDKSPEPSDHQQSTSQMNAFEKKVVELTNQERTKAGLAPLKSGNAQLAKMARAKSQDMRDRNYFDHQSPTYGSPFDMMKKYGINYRAAGENIAAGQKTPEEVVQGWMNSPGHRANILNANFTTIGVGFVEGGSYGTYWTQEFIGE
ncbi:CAP domain-containing protein [Sporolactobacillus sp. Y61]|uniref:CAP domain-containing protein n=1 Tax=Sporolactobacillus sp. Y61 TaxID=3160863 RepID=A0AAU8ICQ3_9BACL